MATTYFDPNAAGTNTAWTGDWSALDDAVRSPTDPSASGDGASISSGTAGALEDANFGTGTHQPGATYTLYIFSASGAKRGLSVSVDGGGSFQTIHGASEPASWHTLDVTGQITGQAALDAFAVRFRVDSTAGGGGAGSVTVHAAYLEQVTATAHSQTPADTLALADARALGVGKAVDDTASVADEPVAGWTADRRTDSPVSLADQVTFDRTVVLADTLALADEATPSGLGVSHSRTPADTLGLADDPDAAWTADRRTDSPVALTDALTIDRTIRVDDTVAVADAVALGRSQLVADTVALTDLVTKARAALVSDPVTVADSLTEAASFARTIADTATLTDQLDRAATFARSVDDTVGLADEATPALNAGGTSHTRNIDDTIGVSDAVTQDRGLSRADTVALADALTTARAIVLTVDDTIGVADQATQASAIIRAIDDTVTVADQLTQARAIARQLDDTVPLDDTLARIFAAHLLFADQVTVTDQAVAEIPPEITPGRIQGGKARRQRVAGGANLVGVQADTRTGTLRSKARLA